MNLDVAKNRRAILAPKRDIVIKELSHFSDYIAAEDLWISIRSRYSSLSIGTVYIALKWMEKRKLVSLKRDEGKRKKFLLKRDVIS